VVPCFNVKVTGVNVKGSIASLKATAILPLPVVDKRPSFLASFLPDLASFLPDLGQKIERPFCFRFHRRPLPEAGVRQPRIIIFCSHAIK
jgi:hypothetical protein